eukprot:TRINITY_DN78606_c0_g1_i1.p1 TRINITY_DN78606_c0_g1~~TRINITY_DN78606_c0_g1_i1.p1  ORF type:complete len:624 (+),score=127.26 TRINITY_DN78606_c0_g1_i1:96-1967(+)
MPGTPSSPESRSRRTTKNDNLPSGGGRTRSNISSSSPKPGRKGSNTSLERRPTGSTTKDKAGKTKSKDRKATNNSSRTGRSATTDADDSSESEVDLDAVPYHLRKAVPLHLVEARILKKNEVYRMATAGQPGKPGGRRVGTREGDHDEVVEEDPDPPPIIEVFVDKALLCMGISAFLAWCLTIIPLILIHVFIFYLSLGDEMHRSNANACLDKLEADLIKELSPAWNAFSMVSVQTGAGLFENDQPYEAIVRSVTSSIKESKRLQYVKVVGAAKDMVEVRPGNVHYEPIDEDGDGDIDVLIAPEDLRAFASIRPSNACNGVDLFFCFDEPNVDFARLKKIEGIQMDASWYGPDFSKIGKKGELLSDPNEWVMIERFLLHANVSIPPNFDEFKNIAVDVGVDLSGASDIIGASTPEQGALFLFTVDGEILAGSGWKGKPSLDPVTGSITYAKVWDLPFAWAQELTPEVIAKQDPSEWWTDERGLVVLKALGTSVDGGTQAQEEPREPGDGEQAEEVLEEEEQQPKIEQVAPEDLLMVASRTALRSVVLMPRDTAVRPLFARAVDFAIAIIGSPLACAIMTGIVFLVMDLMRWCRHGCPCDSCRCCCCRKKRDDFPWALDATDDY